MISPPSANHLQDDARRSGCFILPQWFIIFVSRASLSDHLPSTTTTMAESKKKAPATHPSCIDMIVAAIGNLKEKNGSSAQAIKKYIASNYKVDTEKLAPHIRKAFVSGVEKGKLVQTKGKGAAGSFKLNAAADKADAKAKKAKEAAKKKAQKEKEADKKKAQKEKAAAKKAALKEKSKKKKPVGDKKKKASTKKADKPKKKATKKTPTKTKKAKPAKKTSDKKKAAKKTATKKAKTPKKAKK